MKVLIIDDEEILLRIWSQLFVGLEVEVFTAENGVKAKELLEFEQIDLVITDIRMPVADGYFVLKYLKHEHNRRVPTFVCSAFIDDEEAILSLYAVTRIIRKPFSFKAELSYFQDLIKHLGVSSPEG